MKILKAKEVELKGEAPFYFKLDVNKLVKIINDEFSIVSVLTTNPSDDVLACNLSTVKTSDVLTDSMFMMNANQIEKDEYEQIFNDKYKNYIV